MIILLLVVCFIVGCLLIKKTDDLEELGYFLIFVCFCLFIVSAILGYNIYRCKYIIPNKIVIYEQENAEIEEKISNTVAKYMEYEKNIVMEISPDDDAITLISLYPELKSDQLISAEIEVYIKNNDKIKQLRDSQANISGYRWWLYFGH